MSEMKAPRPDWVPLHLAPFFANREIEPSDADLIDDEAACRDLVTRSPDGIAVLVEWASGHVNAEQDMRGIHDETGFGSLLPKRLCAHPIAFGQMAERAFGVGPGNRLSRDASAFWERLTARLDLLLADGALVVHARGAGGIGFRALPYDVWTSSEVDWAAGTCRTPDGRVFWSVHVGRRSEAAPRQDIDPVTCVGDQRAGFEVLVSTDAEAVDVRTAARITGISKSSLDKYRSSGGGPPFYKVGNRCRYLKSEIEVWMRARSRG